LSDQQKMTSYQWLIIVSAVLIAGVVLIFPPMSQNGHFLGLKFVLIQFSDITESTGTKPQIDKFLLSIFLMIVVVVAGLVYVLAMPREIRKDELELPDLSKLKKEEKKDPVEELANKLTKNDHEVESTLYSVIRDKAIKLIEKNELNEATILLQRALQFRPREVLIADPDYINSMYYLSHLYAHSGNNKEAEDIFQRILEIREFLFGPYHPTVVSGLHEYAHLLREMGETNSADVYEALAEDIQNEIYKNGETKVKPSEIMKKVKDLSEKELPQPPFNIEVTFDPEKQLTGTTFLKLTSSSEDNES